jgi:hypothetical protein
VEPSCWKGILINSFTKIKNKKINNNNIFLFYLELLKMELPKKHIFNIFQIWSTGRRLSLAFSLKPLEGDIFCLENIDF